MKGLSWMKRVFALLLTATMIFMLCACGSDEEPNWGSQDPVVNLPNNGRKAPSEEVIMEDINNELQSKNQYATITGVETVKSLTEDGSYEITLLITAETKYADWTYTAGLFYTEYDQGWILDNIAWNAEKYKLERLPDENEMRTQVYDSLKAAEWSVGVEQSLMEIEELSITMNETLETEIIVANFTTVKRYTHGEIVDYCTANWMYNPSLDEWESIQEDGEILVSTERAPTRITVNPSGNWGDITISNFTIDGFDAQWNGKEDHFSYVGANYITSNNIKYSSENGTDILICISNTWLEITIGDLSNGNYNIEAFVIITERLPSLS